MEDLWQNVLSTYEAVKSGMKRHFGMGEENEVVNFTHFVPDLSPAYRKHREALVKLFEHFNVNPRMNGYYLEIKQLEETGCRKCMHGKEMRGIPVLPRINELLDIPSVRFG